MSKEIKSKKCSVCSELKIISEFYKYKNVKHGYRAQCKECRKIESRSKTKSEYNKLYYSKNKKKEQLRRKKYYEDNKKRESEKAKEYYNDNKNDRVEYSRKYRKSNRELANQRTIKWRENNPDKVKSYGKKYREENQKTINEKYRAYIKNRLLSDDDFRIKTTIRNRFRREVQRNCNGKGWRELFKITGYEYNDYSVHFNNNQEQLFKKYKETSDYHIDHIIPVSIYNFTNNIEISKCWNPRNLRIISSGENQTKKDKIDITLIKLHKIEDLLPEWFLLK